MSTIIKHLTRPTSRMCDIQTLDEDINGYLDKPKINPYLAARKSLQDLYSTQHNRERLLFLIVIASLVLNLVLVAGIVFTASQKKWIPYVVAVNELGDALPVKRADAASPVDKRIVRAQLARWIKNVRSVYLDQAAQKALVLDAYTSINRKAPAYGELNDYFQKKDPFLRAQESLVKVSVESVMPISENTWRVEWKEQIRGRTDGKLVSELTYQATITTSVNPPEDEKNILMNPLGIYVDDFTWSQRLQ
jgi:type IV secretory pathway TrbF-like protein